MIITTAMLINFSRDRVNARLSQNKNCECVSFSDLDALDNSLGGNCDYDVDFEWADVNDYFFNVAKAYNPNYRRVMRSGNKPSFFTCS
jgi:hypothetical protein